jgi:hypothetical protein
MYRRFLNNTDYKGIITEKALAQLCREDEECIDKAEEAAEASILEYLTENYEVEKELLAGKSIREYSRQITYPAGAFFYKEGKIWETMRTINGYKPPKDVTYWKEYTESMETDPPAYLQLSNYTPGDIVCYARNAYKCLEYNGIDFNNICIPGLTGWERVQVYGWEANLDYNVWEAAKWDGKFYALLNKDDIDLTENPAVSDNWGLIGDYDPEYDAYEYSDHEYAVLNGNVYIPSMEVNADRTEEGYNITLKDPRNANLKKHILRMSVYELHKLISPNNVSLVRITDYEASLQWLRDASKLRINPQIPRKLDENKIPVSDWQIATFQRNYDPYQNPWQI